MAKCFDLGAEYWLMYAFSVAYGHWRIAFVSRVVSAEAHAFVKHFIFIF